MELVWSRNRFRKISTKAELGGEAVIATRLMLSSLLAVQHVHRASSLNYLVNCYRPEYSRDQERSLAHAPTPS